MEYTRGKVEDTELEIEGKEKSSLSKLVKGTQTEKNLLTAFAVNHRRETGTHSLPARLGQNDVSRLLTFSKKLLVMRKNTPRYSSSISKEAM